MLYKICTYNFLLINVDIVKKALFICFSNFFQLLSHFIHFQLWLLLKATLFSEFSSVFVVFFAISAAVTLMVQDCITDRSLHSLIKCLFSSHCMHSCFVQCSVTFFSDTHHALCFFFNTHYALCFFSVFAAVTLTCLIDSQFIKSV